MNDVTEILQQIDDGDPSRADQLLPLVYDELRKLAKQRLYFERSDQTLQSTDLVHEAYLRLVKPGQLGGWDSRGHFFAAAAEAMRRILIDHARRKNTLRRGGNAQRISLTVAADAVDQSVTDLLGLDEALTRLQKLDQQKADLVKLRYFAGLTISEAASALNISVTTANRHWAFARAWLHDEIARDEA